MTKDEFVEDYCNRSQVTLEWLSKFRTAVPCDCGESVCAGWQMVSTMPQWEEWYKAVLIPGEEDEL